MRKMLQLASMAFLMALGGCTGTLQTVLDLPISSDKLDEPNERNKLKTLSGDRRLVRVAADTERPAYVDTRGRVFYSYDICAETQADAITTRGASSTLTVEGEAGLSDTSTQAITITNTRSTISDVVRQLAWQLCSARMNDDLSKPEYAAELKNLVYNSMAVLQQTAMGASSKALPLRGAPDVTPSPPTPPVPAPPAALPITPALPVTTTTTTITKVGT